MASLTVLCRRRGDSEQGVWCDWRGEVNDLLIRRQITMISVLSDFLEVNPKSQIFDLEPK